MATFNDLTETSTTNYDSSLYTYDSVILDYDGALGSGFSDFGGQSTTFINNTTTGSTFTDL